MFQTKLLFSTSTKNNVACNKDSALEVFDEEIWQGLKLDPIITEKKIYTQCQVLSN